MDGRFTYSDVRKLSFDARMVMQVYPNPVQQFMVVNGLKAKGTIQVLTIDGKLAKQFVTTGSMMRIDMSELPGGMYIVSYRNQDILQQQKVIKE